MGASPDYYKRMIKTPHRVIVKGRNSLRATKELKDEINAWLAEQWQAGNLNGCWLWSIRPIEAAIINASSVLYNLNYYFSDLEDATLFRLRF